ncbi:MAG TPA: heparinase II/III family protein [Verrucomicrobiae bacterium]|nr:heparinase II/III family protein [Verrucomicrobiae bacterium]
MKLNYPRAVCSFLCLVLFVLVSNLRAAETIDAARVNEIAAMLPPHAVGVGRPISDRAAWKNALTRHPELRGIIRQAARDAAIPLPAQPDSLYLEFSRDGNRDHWQNVAFSRRARIGIFTLAECLEDKGRFIAPLEQAIQAICAERAWVLPAHDGRLQNFYGKTVDIELGSSMLAADLATADYLLGDRLSPETRELIQKNLERRIFKPFDDAVNGDRPEFRWMRAMSNNWDAVCYDGVTAAALATIDSPEQRARFIAVAEKNLSSYLDGGFTPDGYCVEGLGYWNYGFGHFILLAENIREVTGGKLDLMSLPNAAQPALFGIRSEILNGVYLSVADCNPDGIPSPMLVNYVARRFDLNLPEQPAARLGTSLYEQVSMAFLPSDLPPIPGAPTDGSLQALPWRTWFPDAGILICRPGIKPQSPCAVAIKGGNNGVNHGHNDAGSFSLVVGTNMVICDPGGEVYTARTFSSRRYESKVLNSFGHAVPVVAGQLQRHGIDARAVVLATNFTETADSIVFDLRSAYSVPDLQKLERTFVYQRGQTRRLEVRDEAHFSTPESFESALVTWGKIQRAAADELTISDGSGAVRVSIDTGGVPFHLRQEIIDEDTENHRKPVHLGIVLDNKALSAMVTLRIWPSRQSN